MRIQDWCISLGCGGVKRAVFMLAWRDECVKKNADVLRQDEDVLLVLFCTVVFYLAEYRRPASMMVSVFDIIWITRYMRLHQK